MRRDEDDGEIDGRGLSPARPRAPRPADGTGAVALDGLADVGLATRIGLAAGLIGAWIGQCYRTEIAGGNAFVWYVVALAAGAAAYLGLPHEPSLVALSLLAGAAALAVSVLRRRREVPFAVLMAVMFVTGIWAAAMQAHVIVAPRLDHERTVTVTGWIVDAETVLNGATRLMIDVTQMSARGLPPDAVPKRITVTLRKGAPHFAVGAGIRFLARLKPLPGPVMPGGYDFARRAFYEGRGGTGFALGRIVAADPGVRPWSAWVAAGISGLRYDIAERIRAALAGPEGAIAAAIIVGETRAIPDAESDALRMSGLPHMITIAGLHMSIVASSVFLTVRLILALIPAVALRLPVKRIAAGGALVATTFYVLMAGPHISAERAYLMCAVMLISIMLGRPALTMRNVALSAVILIAANPAQVVEPGFLMSYLAVIALIAAYQAWSRYRAGRAIPRRRGERHPVAHLASAGVSHMSAAAWSSLIATLATASVTVDQFYRVPPYGALTNFIVLPAIDMVAMPAAVLACLLMPFGLESIPLTAMGWSIDFMTTVGRIAAGLPGGQGLIGRIHPLADGLAILGLLWLCLWQQPWRLLGVAPILGALALAPFAERPDVMIGEGAMPVAVRDDHGVLRVLAGRQDRFTVANWLMADAAAATPANVRAPIDAALKEGWTCDPLGCVFLRPASARQPMLRVAVATDARAFEEDCFRADIVISRLKAPQSCSDTAYVIDRTRLQQTGAATLQLTAITSRDRTSPDGAAASQITAKTNMNAEADGDDPPQSMPDHDQDGDQRHRIRPWAIKITPALADASRAWRTEPPHVAPLASASSTPAASAPIARTLPARTPSADADDTDIADPTAPVATDTLIRDMMLAPVFPERRSPNRRGLQPPVTAPRLDATEALDPSDPP